MIPLFIENYRVNYSSRKEHDMDKSTACAQVYGLFAEFCKEPVESFYQALVNGQVDAELTEYFRHINCPLLPGLGRRSEMTGGFSRYKEQYLRVFNGPSVPFYPPVESMYRVWTVDETARVPWAKEKRHYFSDGALHVQYIFEALGLAIPEEFRYTPDHLALELELVSLLMLHAKEEDKRRFLRDHLAWLNELAADLNSLEEGRFLAKVVNFIDQFIAWDLQTTTQESEVRIQESE